MDGVVLLVSEGFSEHEVVFEWPYDKFYMYCKSIDRVKLRNRVDFSSDVAHSIAGLFGTGKGKDNPLTEHVGLLNSRIEDLSGS